MVMLFALTIEHSYAEKRIDCIDLVVFDFDKTITHKHSQGAPEDEVLITPEGQVAFKELVEDLLSKGKKVGIASYGKKATILREMNKIWAEGSPFNPDNVITPPDVTPSWEEGYEAPKGYNKNHMLEILKTRFGIAENHKVALIEDSCDNARQATLDGFRGKLVPARRGMNMLAPQIKTWLEAEDDFFYG